MSSHDDNFGDVIVLIQSDSTDGNTTITNDSPNTSIPVVQAGGVNIEHEVDNPRAGNTSLNNPSNGYLTLTKGLEWLDYTLPWTIEISLYGRGWGGGSSQTILGDRNASGGIQLFVSGGDNQLDFRMRDSSDTVIIDFAGVNNLGALSDDTWYDIAIQHESGGTVRAYVNGTEVRSATPSGTITNPSEDLHLFVGPNDLSRDLDGQIDYLRVTEGVARHAAGSYTVSVPFPTTGESFIITQQPISKVVPVGGVARFEAEAVGVGEVSYQWARVIAESPFFENIEGETSSVFQFITDETTPNESYLCLATDDEATISTNPVTLTISTSSPREGLIWNFEDDNFTWFDASHENSGQLDDVVCMRYMFNPGWSVRWQDLIDSGTTWDDLTTDGTTWQDFYSGGAEENMFWLTENNLLLSDQMVKTDGMKRYRVNRDQIDFSDVVPSFTTGRWLYAKQFYFHLQSPRLDSSEPNPFDVAIGWANSMMDIPDYTDLTTVNLQTIPNDGRVKWDFRSTGRYLALKMEFHKTQEIQMTGAEIDVEQTHGR